MSEPQQVTASEDAPPRSKRKLFWTLIILFVATTLPLLTSSQARVVLYSSLHNIDNDALKDKTFEWLCAEREAASPTLLRLVAERDASDVGIVIDSLLMVSDIDRANAIKTLIQTGASRPDKNLDYCPISGVFSGQIVWATLADLANDEDTRIREETWCLLSAACPAYQQSDSSRLNKNFRKPDNPIRPIISRTAGQFINSQKYCPSIESYHAFWLNHDLNSPKIVQEGLNRSIITEAIEPELVRRNAKHRRSWNTSSMAYRAAKTGKFLNLNNTTSNCAGYDLRLYKATWEDPNSKAPIMESELFARFASEISSPAEFCSSSCDPLLKSTNGISQRLGSLSRQRRRQMQQFLKSQPQLDAYQRQLSNALETASHLESKSGPNIVKFLSDNVHEKSMLSSLDSKFYSLFRSSSTPIATNSGLQAIYNRIKEGKLNVNQLKSFIDFLYPENPEYFTARYFGSTLSQTRTIWQFEAEDRKLQHIKWATQNTIDVSALSESSVIKPFVTANQRIEFAKNRAYIKRRNTILNSIKGALSQSERAMLAKLRPHSDYASYQGQSLPSVAEQRKAANFIMLQEITRLNPDSAIILGQNLFSKSDGTPRKDSLQLLYTINLHECFRALPKQNRFLIYRLSCEQNPLKKQFFEALFLSTPSLESDFVDCLEQAHLPNKIKMLSAMRDHPWTFQHTLKPLMNMTRSASQSSQIQLDLYSSLVQAIVQIDRTGNSVIPLLLSLAKNKDLSYIHRAIAICGLRRYYELNRVQSDLKQLISILNGDLKIVAERSLERVSQLQEQELIQ